MTTSGILQEFLCRFDKDDAIFTTKEELEQFLLEALEEYKDKDHSKKLCKRNR